MENFTLFSLFMQELPPATCNTWRNEKFFALHFPSGIILKPEINLLEHQSCKKIPDFHRNDVKELFSSNPRVPSFQWQLPRLDRDRRYQVRPLVECLVAKFKDVHTLAKYRLTCCGNTFYTRMKFRDNVFGLSETSVYLWNLLVF